MSGPGPFPRPRRGFRRRAGARSARALLVLSLSLLPGSLSAQQPAEPRLRGEVVKDGAPVAGGTVVLHRVTREDAGEVDSVRLGSDGSFEFALPAVPDPEGRRDVYFASIRYQGIFYFGAAVTRPVQLDSLYTIEVHDTARAPAGGAELPVSHRTLFLEEGEEAWEVTDLFELRNDGGRTVVAAPGAATWTYPLPGEARDFRTGQGDFPPDAVAFSESGVQVSAPMPPGRRVFVVRYSVPSLDLVVPLPGTTEVMEVLIREPAPPVDVRPLAAAPPVELEPGSTYRTFTGEDLRDTEIRMRPSEAEGEFPVEWLAVILALVLAVAGLAAVGLGRRQRPSGGTAPAPEGPPTPTASPAGPDAPATDGLTRQELVLEIARLDEAFEAKEDPTPEDEARYRARRRRLLERLASLE